MSTTATASPTTTAPAKRRKPRIPKARKNGGKFKLLTLDCLDQRTLAFRKAHELGAAIEQDLGGRDQLSRNTRTLIERNQFLNAWIESSETEWLAGRPIDLNGLLTAINSQRRILTTLGLERRSKDVTPTLSEYLMQHVDDDEPDSGAAT